MTRAATVLMGLLFTAAGLPGQVGQPSPAPVSVPASTCARNNAAAIAVSEQAVAAAPESLSAQLDLARCYDAAWRWNDVEPAIARALQIAEALAAPVVPVPIPVEGRLIAGIHVPIPGRTKDVNPEYPYKAYAAGLGGLVIVELVVDSQGNVRDSRVVRSIPGFDEVALRAARRWKFAVTRVGGTAVEVVTFGALRFGAPAEPVPSDFLDVAQVHQEQGRPTLARAALRTALVMARDDRERFGGAGGERGSPPGPDVTPPKKTRHVNPHYPSEALQMRLQGKVIIEALIDTRGNVGRTHIVSKPSILDAAASAAVGQWQFVPAMKDGTPVATRMTVTVEFSLR